MKEKNVKDLVTLIFKALALAMGVAVVALSIMNAIDVETAITMLGIGCASSGAALLCKRGDK
ncbi:MAG: hypothetical protein IJ433_09245 [Ruminococcus sp.]|nr:hypothetical protein [Ruminococcus sp.]